MMSVWEQLFRTGIVMRQALAEQQECISNIYSRLAPCLSTPTDTPSAYKVGAAAIPDSFYSWRRNIFSTLFHSVYIMLDLPHRNRMLYGSLIHLYRIWVTSADNLLDNEDKVVVPISMPGQSRVMRQVVALMASDRALAGLLSDAVRDGLLDDQRAALLSRETLSRLLPSAAQEATEEGGITARPDPEHVLDVIHRLKTGLLFNLTFVAPEIVETRLPPERVSLFKDALMAFGLGCQLLDDIRDMARDHIEKRHNYVLSWITHRQPSLLATVQDAAVTPADRLYLKALDAALPTAQRAARMMRLGLQTLGKLGLGCSADDSEQMTRMMFTVLDLEGLTYA